MNKIKFNKRDGVIMAIIVLAIIISSIMSISGYEGSFFADGYIVGKNGWHGNYSPEFLAFVLVVDLSIIFGIPINRRDLFKSLRDKYLHMIIFIIIMLIINGIGVLAVLDIINFFKDCFN